MEYGINKKNLLAQDFFVSFLKHKFLATAVNHSKTGSYMLYVNSI